MARYTCSFVVNASLQEVPVLLSQILEACDFRVVFEATDYVMAKESPGKVSLSELVSVQVLIESTLAKKNEVPVTFVVKNDQLPLNPNNHCQQRFQELQTTLNQNQQWSSTTAVPR